jgi:HSP20 family protein
MLMRFDPFRELDRLTQDVFGGDRRLGMPMDAFRRDDQVVVHLDVPGVEPDSIDVTVDKDVLTVTAERHRPAAEGDQVVVIERPQGRFTRRLFLGKALDAENIEARYEHGVLTLTVPVAEKAKPRKVEISRGEADTEAIDASSTVA